jgi:phosphoglycolate phosphatase-like HAD superfamily hydrolase
MGPAVILDVDGTLVDSNDAHAAAWVDAFTEAGITVDRARVRSAIGMGGDKLMPYVSGFSESSPTGKRISERRGQIFKEKYLPHLRPFPRVRELVQRFARDGFLIAVASSAQEDELGSLLHRAGVADLVRTSTSSDDADRSKPDPDIVAAAIQRVEASRAETMMLGDTPYDVAAATAAGIPIVGVECGGWGREDLAGAAAVYFDPADLLATYEHSPFALLKRRVEIRRRAELARVHPAPGGQMPARPRS